jgi:hypothetical protein
MLRFDANFYLLCSCLLLCSSTCCKSFLFFSYLPLINLLSHSHSLSAELALTIALPFRSCHQLPPSTSTRIQNCKSYPFLGSFLLAAYDITTLPRPLSPPAPPRSIQTFTAPSGTLAAPFHTLTPLQHLLAPSHTSTIPSRTLSHLHTISHFRGTFSRQKKLWSQLYPLV